MNFRSVTDKTILNELGERIRLQRLNQNMAQAELSRHAGVDRIVVHRLENGLGCTLESLIRILRALGALEQLDAFLPPPGVSPLQLAELRGRERQRASGRRRKLSREKL